VQGLLLLTGAVRKCQCDSLVVEETHCMTWVGNMGRNHTIGMGLLCLLTLENCLSDKHHFLEAHASMQIVRGGKCRYLIASTISCMGGGQNVWLG
jgi:hypothetical protein